MDILVLHNDNIPQFLRGEKEIIIDKFNIYSTTLRLSPTDTQDFDTYIHSELSKISKSGKDYRLIVLPYSFTSYHFDYTGLTIVAHIRLTKEWGWVDTPILFIGPDSKDDIITFAELGNIIYTYNIFTSNKSSERELIADFNNALNNSVNIDVQNPFLSKEHLSFQKQVSIPQPPNSGPHSLTNKWCISQWFKYMGYDYSEESNYNLYFKSKSILHQSDPVEDNKLEEIKKTLSKLKEGTRILLIDDNEKWHQFFKNLLGDTKAVLNCIGDDFNKSDIPSIKKKIEAEINGFEPDVILLDFRLKQDSDNELQNTEDISGAQILEYIKGTPEEPGKSFGRQVLIFSATSRIENILKLQELCADDFIIKEKIEDYTGKGTTGDLIKGMVENIIRAKDRADYLIPLNEKLIDLTDLLKNYGEKQYGKDLISYIKSATYSVRLISQNNQLTENVLKLIYLNLFGIFEEIKRDKNFVKFEWKLKDNKLKEGLKIKANNKWLRVVDIEDSKKCKSGISKCGKHGNFKPSLIKDDSNIIKYCKDRDLKIAIGAIILFRLGYQQVDESDWNKIRLIRNYFAHGDDSELKDVQINKTLDNFKLYSRKMLELINQILDPQKINEVSPKL